jgi:acyl-CoA thioester hydrolase
MYKLEMITKDDHIDFQDIMDGLYYPFYMEECRHKYIKDVLGIDIIDYAEKGFNLILSEYTIKFKSSIKKGDFLEVTCELLAEECSKIKMVFKQTILVNEKVVAEGKFFGTCVPAAGGRPFLPREIEEFLAKTN